VLGRHHLPGRVPLLVHPGKDHGIIESCELLQRHICAYRIVEAGDVELDLLELSERRIAAGECHEPRAIVVQRSLVSQHRQFANGTVRERRTESGIHQLDELWPHRFAIVAVEPKMGIIKEIECRERHALVLRRAMDMEITFTPVEPWQRVAGVVELRKLQLVRRGNEITVVVVVFHAAAIVGWAARHLVVRHHVRPIDLRGQCGMRPIDTFYHRSECILLGAQLPGGRLQCGHLVIDGVKLRRLGVQALQDGPEDLVDLAARARTRDSTHRSGNVTWDS
jgi:hypothetical protein